MAFPDDDDSALRTDTRPKLRLPPRVNDVLPPPEDQPPPPVFAPPPRYAELAQNVLGAPPAPPRPRAAAPAAMPGMPDLMSMVPTQRGASGARPEPPTPQYSDPLMALGKPLSVIALAASLFTRRPAVAAMNAMAGAMEGQRQGDQERYLNNYREYQQQLAKWKEEDAAEKALYDQILKDRKLSFDERNAKLRTTAHRRGDSLMLAGIDQGNPQGVLDTRGNLGKPISTALTDRQRIMEIKKEHAGDNGGQGITLPQAQAILKAEKKEAADNVSGTSAAHMEKLRGLHGQDLLDAIEDDPGFPPGTADEVKAIAEGRAPLPAGKWGQTKRQLAFQYKEGLRGQTYGARQAGERNLSAGELRRNIRSVNTLVGHLGRLDQNIDYLNTTSFKTANKALVAWAKETGDPRITRVLADVHAVSEELGRVFKGTVTEGEIERTLGLIDASQTPQALHTSVQEFIELMNGRLQEMEREAKEVTGRDDVTVLSPGSKETLGRIEGGPPGGKPIGWSPDGKRIFELPDGSRVSE